MIDTITEDQWRAVAKWDVSRPEIPYHKMIQGLPGRNAQIMSRFRERMVEFAMCRSERILHGIPITHTEEDSF